MQKNSPKIEKVPQKRKNDRLRVLFFAEFEFSVQNGSGKTYYIPYIKRFSTEPYSGSKKLLR